MNQWDQNSFGSHRTFWSRGENDGKLSEDEGRSWHLFRTHDRDLFESNKCSSPNWKGERSKRINCGGKEKGMIFFIKNVHINKFS